MAVQNKLFRFNSIRSRLFLGFVTLGLIISMILIVFTIAFWQGQSHQDKMATIFHPTRLFTQQILDGLQKNTLYFQEGIYIRGAKPYRENKRITTKIKDLWAVQIQPCLDTLKDLVDLHQSQRISDDFIGIQKQMVKLENATQLALKSLDADKDLFPSPSTLDTNGIYFNAALQERLYDYIMPMEEKLSDAFYELMNDNKIVQSTAELNLLYKNNTSFYILIALISLLIILVIFFIYHILDYVSSEIRRVSIYAEEFISGEIPKRIRNQSEEFNKVSIALNRTKIELTALREFALLVGTNELEMSVRMFNDEGELGKALAKMREGLKNISQDNARRYWNNYGVAKFSEIITKNADDINRLAQEIISNLVEYLEINQGGFFTVEMDARDRKYLALQASYAYNKRRFIKKEVELGQGLVGQVWQEGDAVYLREVPEDYVEITSGLGAATPKALYILPLRAGAEIHGVIELASLHEIEPYRREFVEKIAANVGQSIAATRNNEQTRFLLQKSEEMNKILQTQEEQMRENMQELQETQQLMTRTQRELSEKEANLDAVINNTSHAIMAFDRDYKITVVNRSMRQLYLEEGTRLEEGKNLLKELPRDELKAHQAEYERALRGEKFDVLRKVEKFQKVSFYQLHYNPIYDVNKKVIGASIFMENITEQQIAEMQLKETEANLSSLINDTEDSIMALDKNYKIIVVNEAYKNEYKRRGMDLQLGRPIFNYLFADEQIKWKEYYDRALKGERFLKVTEEDEDEEKTYREYWFNPIRNERDDITGISIFSRNITESKTAEIKVRRLLLESLEDTEKLKAQEAKMRSAIEKYELRIQELENKIAVKED